MTFISCSSLLNDVNVNQSDIHNISNNFPPNQKTSSPATWRCLASSIHNRDHVPGIRASDWSYYLIQRQLKIILITSFLFLNIKLL